MTTHLDRHGRPLRNLRISVTDRCNLRCGYCMPEQEYTWLPQPDLLRFEEISRLVDVFVGLGVRGVRLTGGEPLLRRGLAELVRQLARKPGVEEVAMTTNAVTLGEHAQALRDAGLSRLTISLDSLRRERFHELTRRDELEHVLGGIQAANQAGFEGTKINTVLMRGTNDDELVPLIELGRELGLEVRFIEYMDVGGATRWRMEQVVPRSEILARIAAHFGEIEPVEDRPSAPADRFRLADGTRFGVISSTTEPFCGSCDRSRLTADGTWFLCLYASEGVDLRGPLRSGDSDAELAERIALPWSEREDRGAQERLGLLDRGASMPVGELRRNPHLEMHTRGG